MAWILLVLAGLFEIGMVIGLGLSDGFSKLWPSLGMIVSALISFSLLAEAMKSIPAGTAYAVWTGVGAAGAVILGIVFLREPAEPARLVAVALILTGVVVLKLSEAV
ncbi:MAG: multidrug efflux SMR transporter [Rubrobacter sp.]|jgi:quaternary ammonium compound-resistance protein SugE|nr:multidrug efflux SMR transporter [Rubrobacteraceae bacterium]MBA3793206.1 multidrug efflux SMR transporter [Rubrobacter sp.]MDQ3428999.1 multidrug efflux SMR transporter [Actinomycetota bacterium]